MHATWYFDFISPFAWLQLRKVLALRERVAVQPVPILFAAVLDKLGQLGPAEIPGKRDFTYRYVKWQAQRQDLPLRFPPAHPFNPLPVLRLCVAAGNTWQAIEKIFVHIWQEGQAADSLDALRELGRQLGLDDLETALGSDAVKRAVRDNTDSALAAGVFGVPTLRLDEQLFWGDDATGMALDYLADPACFDSGEYARISTLPQAVQRRR